MDTEIRIQHNFDSSKFMWLYAKYACGANPQKHCTNAILGRYSKTFSKHNPEFLPGTEVVLNEYPELGWDAIYICGVSKKGYSTHKNYPHNVHVALVPAPGENDQWAFENWVMTAKNARFEYVISEEDLEEKYKSLPGQYVTCRMFRWAVSHYKEELK